jgi:mRNA-degrading endonuclease RelE of RelBE toxin-antitoxin system
MGDIMTAKWQVRVKRKVQKKLGKLPGRIRELVYFLIQDIRQNGPVRGDWPNYSLLGENRHHCHLKKGKPTYVAVWEVKDAAIRLVEVVYVGTHEKAPY